ncbi:hypothetical protein RhiirA1_484350 [Rhizophagus irregularis]|uniref:Uncharacterized protein n=1 Tax=Rhizophagus irregularis TaxID=588596 RepID=A0A2N0QJE8_9GLOM|nr:hypothetical protein RhiirA1_484350 [Rhizophagus irregularis]
MPIFDVSLNISASSDRKKTMPSYYVKHNIFRFRQFRHVETISAFRQIREPMSKCRNSFDNFDMLKLPNFGRQLYQWINN